MKVLLLMLLIAGTNIGQAQHKPWERYNMDSAVFTGYFGSPDLFGYQMNMAGRSTCGSTVLFAGAPIGYISFLENYLAEKHVITKTEKPGQVIIKVENAGVNPKPGIAFTAVFNVKNNIITSVKMTGRTADLQQFFIRYWQQLGLPNTIPGTKTVWRGNQTDKITLAMAGPTSTLSINWHPGSGVQMISKP